MGADQGGGGVGLSSRRGLTADRSFEAFAIPCGSEPARDSGGSVALMLNVPPSSRAGSLPQGFWVFSEFRHDRNGPRSMNP
ncbi:hypothetical protein FGE05_23240 [Pseudomonas sp. ICMP22404]|nr:hypothetical protein FGE05_23240 [Pseudomonas sp. ICMP22404]